MKYNPDIVIAYWVSEGIPTPELEFKFCNSRRWVFDFAWPWKKLYLEVEGGAWGYGRHNRAAGFVNDMEKYNSACRMGWRGLRVQPDDVCMLDTVQMIKEALDADIGSQREVLG